MCQGRQSCRRLSQSDLDAAKRRPNSCVITIDGRAYDVANFLCRHPGGALALENCRGQDASVQFSMYHPELVRKFLPTYCIGQIEPCELDDNVNEADNQPFSCGDVKHQQQQSPIVRDYFALRDKFHRMGLFQTKPTWELGLVLRILCLLAASVACVLCPPESAWPIRVVLAACILGIYLQQLAFVGHDLGHTAVTHNRLTDHRLAAFLGNALLGISIGWWKLNHNVHHLVTNSVTDDPDIQHMPLLAITDEFFSSPISTFYDGKRKPFFRLLMRVQHLVFYPVMCVARFYLYIRSYEHLIALNQKRERRYFQVAELVSMSTFFIWYLTLACQLPTWPQTIAFVLLSHAVSGLLHVQICISHFPMAVCDYKNGLGTVDSDDGGHFIRSQVASTMDVDCPTWMDWFHGGLQFQLEHHLYPRLPRHHLRAAAPLVKEFCQKHGMNYVSLSFLQSNIALYCRLRDVASKAADWRPE
ncbi:hypothetical protein BOX15_Mlig009045g1 [Macrostomum lignano]|uniref:Cytochrome b5 heme-binding domain-containing protein n=1 Tax=Macrostomum lignano TaxID=282301 RepID=A0A267EVR4_9PLAT|nr:hypothetical protein BOX15_Mlig009045g4 [Macrostomum lignano]PAA64812.1 hypothetical protein BOX15_Mlig009045g1 [Macrostomum lignano]